MTIEKSKEIRLDELRDQVKRTHLKPMKELAEVEAGVAAFDNLLQEYHEAGGTEFKDQEKKSDLLKILPDKIRSHLIWHSTDNEYSYTRFRDMILTQSGRVIHAERRGPLHAVQGDKQ